MRHQNRQHNEEKPFSRTEKVNVKWDFGSLYCISQLDAKCFLPQISPAEVLNKFSSALKSGKIAAARRIRKNGKDIYSPRPQ